MLTDFLAFLAQDDKNAVIGGTLEDEDESSDDPNLQVRKLRQTEAVIGIFLSNW